MRSFSENDPDIIGEGKNVKTVSGSSNLLVTILLILAVSFVAFYAYMKSQDRDLSEFSLNKIFSAGSSTENVETVFKAISEIQYESNENTAFAVYKDYIVKAGANGIELLDKNGTQVWHDSVPMSKPVIKSNGTEILVADINGMDFVVINGKSEKWKGKSDGKIVNADISADGHVAILNNAKRYGGEVIVLNSEGTELFKAFIADNSPLSAKVSPSSGELVVNCLNTTGVRAQTYIKSYDKAGNPLAGKTLEPVGSIYPVMWHAGDDLVYLAGDTAITLIDKTGEQKWTKESDIIYSTCMAGSRNFAAAVKDKDGISLKIFGTNGHELSSYSIDSEVTNLSSFGNIIAVNTVREVHFVNDRGKALGKYTSKSDILDVHFFNKYEAAIVSKSSVTVINLK